MTVFDVDKWMKESGYDVLDADVVGDARNVKINRRRRTTQEWYCDWLCEGRWHLEPGGYRVFEETFHTTSDGLLDDVVERICERHRRGDIKLERKVRKRLRERFGARI